jgi:pimeloyl-ACP methyl ester carboxylesterase
MQEQEKTDNKETTNHKEETYIKFNGTNYIYQKANNNDNITIICISGIGGYTGIFTDLAHFILNKNQYNVLRYDLFGRGHSDYPADNIFDADSHLKQLRDLIVHLNLDKQKYILIGHSMGGCLATAYSNKFPDEVKSLILLAPAGIMDFQSIQWMKTCPTWLHPVVKMPLQYIQEVSWRLNYVDHWSPAANKTVAELYELHKQVPTLFEAVWQCLMQFPLYGSEDIVETLANNSTIEVLLMWGKKDQLVPYNNLNKWRQILEKNGKQFTCISYEELGHHFFFEERERALNDIYNFLISYL